MQRGGAIRPFAFFHRNTVNAVFPPPPVASPCIGVCTLDAAGYCIGCLRTAGEIGQWLAYSEAERRRIMNVVLPQRESDRGRDD